MNLHYTIIIRSVQSIVVLLLTACSVGGGASIHTAAISKEASSPVVVPVSATPTKQQPEIEYDP